MEGGGESLPVGEALLEPRQNGFLVEVVDDVKGRENEVEIGL